MRIAFVTPEYITEVGFDGGLANYLHRVCTALAGLGHEPIVIVASNADAVFEHEGVSVVRVNPRTQFADLIGFFRKGGFFPALSWAWQSWVLNRALRRLHREKKIDIVQFASYMATGLFRPRGIASVVRLSSFQPLWFAAYENFITLPNRLIQYLEMAAIKRADRVICPGKPIADAVERITGKKVYLIESPYVKTPCSSDTVPYETILKGKKYLLFFGTVGILKGIRTLGDIMSPLLEKHPDLFFAFAGKDIGCSTGPMMDYVRSQAGPHCHRVVYLGILPHSQLFPVIENANAVVLPSRIDNFPNTCIEAMARGKIVVGTRGASFEQLIDDGESGFLCAIDDGTSLLQAIERALSLPEREKARMQEKAKQRIALLSPEKTVRALIAIYDEVVQKKKGERLTADGM